MTEYLILASTFFLGLFAGGMLTEALLLAPFFRSLSFDQFYRLHHEFGPRLYRFYAPLTISATFFPIMAGVVSLFTGHTDKYILTVNMGLSLAILAIYFGYFQKANLGLANESFDKTALTRELRIWSTVHNGRTVLALANFVLALIAQSS